MQRLSIEFFQALVGGTWSAFPPPGFEPSEHEAATAPWVLRVEWIDDDGHDHLSLPDECSTLVPLISRCEDLLADHYEDVRLDASDVTIGWTDEGARQEFVRTMDRVGRDARRLVVASPFGVDVEPEPGLNVVMLMGEYGCEWPLWNRTGATEPDSWPMVSAGLADKLRAWAAIAEPDHWGDPDPDDTQRLVRHLQAELGDRYRVIAHV